MMTRNICEKLQGSVGLVLSMLALICLASCYPEFKNPIPPPVELRADHQILGTWVRTYKTEQSEYKEQLSIFRRSNGWIDAVWIYDIDKKESTDGINLLVLEGYTTSVNRRRFLCLRVRKRDLNWAGQRDRSRSSKEVGQKRFLENWIIVNYETLKNELVIKPFSTQRVEELIEKGKLKGEVGKASQWLTEPGLSLDQVTVTSSSDELAQAIAKEGTGAFIWDDPNDTFRPINVLVFSRTRN